MKKLKLWGLLTLTAIGMSLAVGVIFSLFSGIGYRNGYESFAASCGLYGITGGFMVIAIMSINIHQLYVPVMLSFGGRRRELLWQIQMMKVLDSLGIALVTGALFGISDRLMGETKNLQVFALIIFVFCILFMVGSLGDIVGVLYNRFGKFAILGIVLICAVCGGGLGFSYAAGFGGKLEEIFSRMEGIGKFGGILAAATILTGLLDLLIAWRTMRKMEVRC